MRKLFTILATLSLLGALALSNAAPAHAAVETLGEAEDHVTYFHAGTGYTFRGYIRMSVQVDRAYSPDRWRWVAHMWCNKQISDPPVPTSCNFGLKDNNLDRFSDLEPLTIAGGWDVGDTGVTGETDWVFTGAWHDWSYSSGSYIASFTGIPLGNGTGAQWRFNAAGGYLTHNYTICSYPVYGPSGATQWPFDCTADLALND